MDDNSSQLPIALRRTPRHSTMRLHASTSPSQRHPRQHAVSKAANAARKLKRAKTSKSSSIVAQDIDARPMIPTSSCHQQSIQTVTPTIQRRKHPKASLHATSNHSGIFKGYDTYGITSPCNEVRVFPLRAILDERVRRRIRRNGLSEEMNNIYNERKQRAKKDDEEMQRLREQLTAKENENDELREQSSLLQDTSRIMELEREIAELRQGLHSDELHNADENDWDMAAADGFTDGGSSVDMDDRFRDDTTLEVESADSFALGQEKPYFNTMTVLTPPSTSPIRSTSPNDSRHFYQATHCDAGVQPGLKNAGQSSLQIKTTQLRCELASLQKKIETSEQLESRQRTRDTPAKTTNAVADHMDPDLQLQADIMLQALAEKTAALTNLNSSISSLGPPHLTAGEIMCTLREAFQSARQELEEMFPGDELLPVSSEGAVVLGNMLQCLRNSIAHAEKSELLVKDSSVREQYLREQLSDRVHALDTISFKLREKDDRIFRLESDMERSDAIVDGYQRSLNEARQAVLQKEGKLTEMEAHLRSMISVAADLKAQLAQVQVEGDIEAAGRKTIYDKELMTRDARILDLHKDITSLGEALAQTRDLVSKLQVENDRLQSDTDRDKRAARDAMASLRTQLLQSLQMSEAFLA